MDQLDCSPRDSFHILVYRRTSYRLVKKSMLTFFVAKYSKNGTIS